MENFNRSKNSLSDIDVFIVEDDRLQQMILLDYCSELGRKALCVESAEEALHYLPHLSERHFVISDMELGSGMTGIDIGKLIKKSCKGIFLAGMSCNSSYQTEALNVGFDLFLIKPITLKKLEDVLNAKICDTFAL